MSLTSPQFSKIFQLPGARVSRLFCAVLCLFFVTAVPALAEPVRINQVIQTVSSSQGAPDLKFNNLITQDQGQKSGTQQAGPRSDNGPGTQGGIKTDSIIAGVTITGEGKTIGVETIEEGEVEGTICDCGDILVAGGAFPKWPFLFLAAVPLAFTTVKIAIHRARRRLPHRPRLPHQLQLPREFLSLLRCSCLHRDSRPQVLV
jgi:hypothetical protein